MSAASSERRFRGQTTSERRAERRARLLEAALDLIGTEGWPAATMTEICRRAGLTERYFYESFRDRDALYVALMDAVAAETQAAVLAAVQHSDPADPRARVRAGAGAVVEVLVRDPRKGRVALVEGLGNAVLQGRRRDILAAFEQFLRDQAPALYGADARRGVHAELSSIALVGAMGELLSRQLDGSLRLSHDDLAEYLADLAMTL